MDDQQGLALALEEAKKGYEEGGVPVRADVPNLRTRGKGGGQKRMKMENEREKVRLLIVCVLSFSA
jgi:hypothetical protein